MTGFAKIANYTSTIFLCNIIILLQLCLRFCVVRWHPERTLASVNVALQIVPTPLRAEHVLHELGLRSRIHFLPHNRYVIAGLVPLRIPRVRVDVVDCTRARVDLGEPPRRLPLANSALGIEII